VDNITISNVYFANWRTTFATLEGPDIAYTMLRGNHASVLRVDDYMFNAPTLPEPASAMLLLASTAVVLRRRRRSEPRPFRLSSSVAA
jgi:hypothetical protein